MKFNDFRAAARRFDVTGKDLDPIEPVEPGPIHAYLLMPAEEQEYLANTYEWVLKQPGTAIIEYGTTEAACGMGVRVIYRMAFDDSDSQVCPRCVDMARLWNTDPDAYHRRVDERHERWADREDRRYEAADAADLARQESYGNEPIDNDDEEND
ncbi:hypothetical protein AU184_14545 [Mycolicibacterium novocastrense]|uniref:hypothetical protein n=1 Tax=Mycolicibacterium novocastrense TaxID=59813 RepID=UPI00074951E8|nr:hypothetical protein [Mycolicibacterium novocastrense]KUH70020.1 hypothetical protein AU183_10860 [Mycolicibacterium novocastrense]KUH78193.1 hypothetical protein AU072_09625 [Mycolicibacterium novocastrense]KUH79528.1 hypothetical protein AU184_14545 [Mycolicibacterium novocastrense]